MRENHPVEIGILLYPGAQLAAVHGLTDLFGVADRLAAGHRDREPGLLRTSHWRQEDLALPPVRTFATHAEGVGSPAVFILPPSLGEPLAPGQAAPLAGWLRHQHDMGAALCSVCAGAFLLGETGLLAGRAVTTHWIYAERFQSRFPDARVDTDKLVIDDGDIITAGGLMAWTDLGLKLVDRFLGPTVMLETARFLLVDPPGRQQRYYSSFSPRLAHGDAAVLKVQQWLQATSANDMRLASMLAQAGLGERTFLRRFQKATGLKPTEYCQQLRVGKARELLQFSNRPVDGIAWEVGYGDTGAFRKIFARITGLTPGEYRRRFSAE